MCNGSIGENNNVTAFWKGTKPVFLYLISLEKNNQIYTNTQLHFSGKVFATSLNSSENENYSKILVCEATLGHNGILLRNEKRGG